MRRDMIKAVGFAMLAMASLAIVSPAMAATNANAQAALQAMKSLNVITLGDYINSGNGDIEGKAWIGGNSSGNKLQVGTGGSGGPSGASSTYKTLTVIGSISNGVDLYNGSASNGTLGNYGAKIGGNVTDSNNGLSMQAAGAAVTIGGYINKLVTSNNSTAMINGALGGNSSLNGSGINVKAATYGGQNVNGLGSGSNVYINGSNPSQNSPPTGWTFNANQTLNAPTTASLASEKSTMVTNMQSLTSQLASLNGASTASKILTGGNSTAYDMLFNVTTTANGYAVFNVSATDLLNARNIGFQFANGTSSSVPIVVNITGLGSGTYDWNLQSGVNGYSNAIYNSSLSSQLVWNLVGATGTLNVNKTLEGSIISTGGTIATKNSNIEGTVVASVFNQSGEVHLGTFNGGDTSGSAISALSTVPTAGAVPETQTWVTMILGFGFIGAMIRRQKQAIMLLRL